LKDNFWRFGMDFDILPLAIFPGSNP